jgi:tRNA1Val (adenine37-N6)-methyltransferase
MKVGTDAILLAVWTSVTNKKSILDIGTGSGVIALLAASKSDAEIDALEIDEKSFAEASLNFLNSPYGKRLHAIHMDFNNYYSNTSKSYELIITNPPFFTNGIKSPVNQRKLARHDSLLNHAQICNGVSKILTKDGTLSIVLPDNQVNEFITTAGIFGLFIKRKLNIYPKPGLHANRVNMEFSLDKSDEVIISEITIRESNGNYTKGYKEYVKDYMLRI